MLFTLHLTRGHKCIKRCKIDSFFPPDFLAGQHGAGDFGGIFSTDASGAGWGMMTLMPGSEKPLRYTDRYHYIFFVVSGAAVVLFGNTYTVPRSERTVREGFVCEVPRGNYYSLCNRSYSVPARVFFAKAGRCRGSKGNRPAKAREGGDETGH